MADVSCERKNNFVEEFRYRETNVPRQTATPEQAAAHDITRHKLALSQPNGDIGRIREKIPVHGTFRSVQPLRSVHWSHNCVVFSVFLASIHVLAAGSKPMQCLP